MDQSQEIKHGGYVRFKKMRENYKINESEFVERIRKQFLELFQMFEGDIRDRMKMSYVDPVTTFKCN